MAQNPVRRWPERRPAFSNDRGDPKVSQTSALFKQRAYAGCRRLLASRSEDRVGRISFPLSVRERRASAFSSAIRWWVVKGNCAQHRPDGCREERGWRDTSVMAGHSGLGRCTALPCGIVCRICCVTNYCSATTSAVVQSFGRVEGYCRGGITFTHALNPRFKTRLCGCPARKQSLGGLEGSAHELINWQ